jgi:tripartite motif-containing protein 43/48/49/64/77
MNSHAFLWELFLDPVILSCGDSFCRPCLCVSWEKAQRPPQCPGCKEPSHHTECKTIIVLRTRVFLDRCAKASHHPCSAEQMCGVHMQSERSYFCEIIKEQMCSICSKSEDHRAHNHGSTDWTAQRVGKQWLGVMFATGLVWSLTWDSTEKGMERIVTHSCNIHWLSTICQALA